MFLSNALDQTLCNALHPPVPPACAPGDLPSLLWAPGCGEISEEGGDGGHLKEGNRGGRNPSG